MSSPSELGGKEPIITRLKRWSLCQGVWPHMWWRPSLAVYDLIRSSFFGTFGKRRHPRPFDVYEKRWVLRYREWTT